MKTTADFLDALRVKLDLPSDGRLAAYLGVHRQYLSRYRNNVITFDDEMAMKVADLLETDPAYVVACMHHQRAKRAEEKKLWERIATSMAGVAATLAMVAVLPFVTLPYSDAGIIADSEHCILCQTGLLLEWLVLSALCALLFALILVWSRPPISSVRYRYSRLSTASASAMVPGFHQARHHHDRIQ